MNQLEIRMHMFLTWPDFPECFLENYTPEVVRKIRENPKSWLNTLPMVEYAHVLMVLTAHHLGGEPTRFVEVLYKQRLSPVLTEYYKALEEYRFWRSMSKRQYASFVELYKDKHPNALRWAMRNCTKQTRARLREICEDFANYQAPET